MTIPIIYLHWGQCNYLQKTMEKTSKYNSNVILLDDNLIQQYDYNAHEQFSSIYQHLSRGKFDFEYKCILRWFIIKNFVKQNKIEKIFYCDSDVMLFTDISQEWFVSEDLCIMEPHKYTCASGHSSLWSLDALSQFGDFILHTYTNNFKVLQNFQNSGKGNVCDMFLIYLFGKNYPHQTLTKVYNNTVFDDNLATSTNHTRNEYEMKNNMKNIQFIDDIPYCKNIQLNKMIKFNSIHFWGHLKGQIS